VADKKQLTAEEELELNRLWKKLVKLYHPDRFAHEPDKLETYAKLTSAINQAKDSGDIAVLREIADDPMGSFCGKAGRRWTSARSRTRPITAGCTRRCNWRSSNGSGIPRTAERNSPITILPDHRAEAPACWKNCGGTGRNARPRKAQELEEQAGQFGQGIEELGGEQPSRIG